MTSTASSNPLPLQADDSLAASGEALDRTATTRFYRPELDGLRFFAFLAVYIEHTVGFGVGDHHRLPNWLGDALGTVGIAGTFGVDLFFVLSSYLITELLLRERALRGFLDVKAFYIRRMLRIWPLYFIFLFGAYGLTFIDSSEGLTWWHLLGFTFFAGNWVYFLAPVTTVAAPLWSVSLEEQFYLIWPWVIRGASARRLAAHRHRTDGTRDDRHPGDGRSASGFTIGSARTPSLASTESRSERCWPWRCMAVRRRSRPARGVPCLPRAWRCCCGLPTISA